MGGMNQREMVDSVNISNFLSKELGSSLIDSKLSEETVVSAYRSQTKSKEINEVIRYTFFETRNDSVLILHISCSFGDSKCGKVQAGTESVSLSGFLIPYFVSTSRSMIAAAGVADSADRSHHTIQFNA